MYVKADGRKFNFNEDFYLNGLLSTNGEVSLPTVFAGYGIDADLYNNYKDLDVTGKAVVILEGEPQDGKGKYLVNDNDQKSSWSGPQAWQKKSAAALAKGATYVFMVSEKKGKEFEQLVKQRAIMAKRMSGMSMKPVEESLSNRSVFTVSEEVGAALLRTTPKKMKGLQEQMNKSAQLAAKAPMGTLTLKVERQTDTIHTENVAA